MVTLASSNPGPPSDPPTSSAGASGPARFGTVLDARGRRVTVVDPGVDWVRGRHDQIDLATLDHIMADLAGEARASRRLVVGGVGAVVGLTAVVAGLVAVDIAIEGRAAWRDLVASLIFTGPAMAMMAVAGILGPTLIARRRRLQGAREVTLRHGHCPHCGYRIAEVPPDPATGHTVCPECGAAWERQAG